MIAFLASNLGLIAFGVILLVLLAAMIWRDTVLDFVKGNFGLIVLLTLFTLLLAVALHVYAEPNQSSADFLAWLEQKAGEVLAAIMTLIVGVRNTNQRSGESGNGKDSSAPVPVPPPSGATHP